MLRRAVPAALAASGVDPADVIGIGVDFTACTILPARADGTPLCEVPQFRSRRHAYPKLWKHHAAQGHADRINALAHERGEPWIARYGGKISSEWAFAKGLQLLEEDPELYGLAERWIEATDWITWQLCGVETRNECTAGFKAIYQDGSFPSADFLGALIPFDAHAKKALELTFREALRMNQNHVGTEHILLALLELEDGTGVLAGLGVDKATADASITAALAASPGA